MVEDRLAASAGWQRAADGAANRTRRHHDPPTGRCQCEEGRAQAVVAAAGEPGIAEIVRRRARRVEAAVADRGQRTRMLVGGPVRGQQLAGHDVEGHCSRTRSVRARSCRQGHGTRRGLFAGLCGRAAVGPSALDPGPVTARQLRCRQRRSGARRARNETRVHALHAPHGPQPRHGARTAAPPRPCDRPRRSASPAGPGRPPKARPVGEKQPTSSASSSPASLPNKLCSSRRILDTIAAHLARRDAGPTGRACRSFGLVRRTVPTAAVSAGRGRAGATSSAPPPPQAPARPAGRHRRPPAR